MEGWIKLHRIIESNKMWTSEPFSRGQAWVDLLILANYKDSFYYKRGFRVDVLRGQVGRSMVELADRWRWSRGKVQRFLNDLENEQQIEQQNNNVTTIISIVNYETYQGDEQQIEQQTGSRRAADGQQTDTYNNVKKEKKVNKFIKPTLDEVKLYCKERGKGVNPVKWFNHYKSNGWKVGKNPMVDWHAAVHTWEDSDIQTPGSIPASKGTNLGANTLPKDYGVVSPTAIPIPDSLKKKFGITK